MANISDLYSGNMKPDTQSIKELRENREREISGLARLYLHPEETKLNEHKRFGELARADREIKRRELADRVAFYAKQYPKQAEGEIGNRLAEAIRQGKDIDLSQKYEGTDGTRATHRHEQALMNLDVFVQQAEKLGYKVNRGEAIAVGQQESLKLAV